MKETIMVFCAHPDDEVIGLGGTIAKYAKEGKNVIVIIFSYGEGSHPWLKKRVTVEIRVSEAKKAGKLLGCRETIFLGLKDTGVKKHGKEMEIEKKIENLLLKYKPSKIFTHSKDDPWIDHQSVYKIMNNVLEKTKFEGDVYSFDIWNPIKTKERNIPKMVIDITKEFKTKMKALSCFKSQKLSMILLYPVIYIRAILNGISVKGRFAEVFYKIR